jgi:hypothetical protein
MPRPVVGYSHTRIAVYDGRKRIARLDFGTRPCGFVAPRCGGMRFSADFLKPMIFCSEPFDRGYFAT